MPEGERPPGAAPFRSDLYFSQEGRSRVDSMDAEMQAQVVEVLEGRAADASQRELRARFYEIAGIAPGRRVLEVGCGTGVDTRVMAAMVRPKGSVLGIDPSDVLLREARRRIPTGLEARFERASGEKIPMADGSVDRAVAITMLSHVVNPLPVVKEMTRVTRSGGRVCLFDHDMGTFVIDAADRETTRLIFDRYTREVSGMDAGRRLFGLLKDSGLKAVQVVALPLVDTEFTNYFQFVVERYPLRAVEDGLLTQEAADAWRKDVRARASAGRFFGSLVYFAGVGVR